VAVICLVLVAGSVYFVLYPFWAGSRHWRRAEQALANLDLARAGEHFRAYLALHPDSAEAHFALARTLRRAEDYSAANRHLREAARLGWLRELIDLERLLQEVELSGARGPARDMLQAYVQARHPDEKFILESLFKADRKSLNLQQATGWLNTWVERHPDDWHPRLWRGEILKSFTQFDQARADYQRLLELKPDHSEALLQLGLIALVGRGDYAEAQGYLERYLEQHPEHPEALLGLARCQKGRGELEAAAATARSVLEKQPGNGEAAYLLGSIEADRGRFEEALPWLKRAEAGGAEPRGTANQLGLVLRRLGKSEEASAYERKFATLNEANQKLEKALLGVLKEPYNPALRHQIGSIHMDLGKTELAVKWFLSALQQDPAHAPSHRALADHFAKQADPHSQNLAVVHRRLAEASKAAPPR
jgi:tetratricopeptide (TPR) repeat protein